MTAAIASGEIWVIDTEWGYRDNRVGEESAWTPVALCAVGLHSRGRHCFWGRDPRLSDFFADHASDLFVAHSATAEMKFLLRLDINLPPRWFDTMVAWRYCENRPGHLDAGLVDALHGIGGPSISVASKEALRERILNLNFDTESGAARQEVIAYCFSDCEGCARLYQHLDSTVNLGAMAHWMEFQKAVSRMELRGIPMDDVRYSRLQVVQPSIRASLIDDLNRTCALFRNGVFQKGRFLHWCKEQNITWPKKRSPETGLLYSPIDNDTLKEMEPRHPFISKLRQVLKTLKHLDRRPLTVDADTRRHYFSTCPFRAVTGRNQPRGFIFNGPKWQRFLIVPESPDHILVYVDFEAQEIGIAAALSRDPEMRAAYRSGDCHMALAILAGAAPEGASRDTYPAVRNQYKQVNLGVMYGQTPYGIAHRLGIPHLQAERLLADHKRVYSTFWKWLDRMVQGAYDHRSIRTPCGWRSNVPWGSNERTWMNWPMQATGGDIMRLTVTYLDRQNVRILAPVHDGFLLSCRREQLRDLELAVDFACRTAVEQVLGDFPLRWKTTVHEERFIDDGGQELWGRLQNVIS
jgi:DNA polymerase I-like protein with 3'-5' exonuclease and polymerase domains